MARGRKGQELTHCSDTGWAPLPPWLPHPCPLYRGRGAVCDMAESTELDSLSIPAILANRAGKVGCPAIMQLKELRPKKGSGVPVRGAESNQKPGPLG